MTTFIAGGSPLLFLPQVPEHWKFTCIAFSALCLLAIYFTRQPTLIKKIEIIGLLFAMGFAWNARYAEKRLENILALELEGKELTLDGRVAALPQSNSSVAKFTFEVDRANLGKELLDQFPRRIYLSWQPAWRNSQEITDITPGHRWNFKSKLKRPYGPLNPYTFDFEHWSFHQDFGASGSAMAGELLLDKDIA